MRGPFQRLFARRQILLALLFGTAIFGVLQVPELDTMSERGEGIIAFELARTPERANEIVTEWGEEGRSAAKRSLLFDYPYLVFYGLLLAGACAAVARRAGELGWGRVAAAGLVDQVRARGARVPLRGTRLGRDRYEPPAAPKPTGQLTPVPPRPQ